MAEYIVRETGFPGTLKKEVVGEIVRCKDCKWMDVFCCCTKFNVVIATKSTFFCALGERRDNAEIH